MALRFLDSFAHYQSAHVNSYKWAYMAGKIWEGGGYGANSGAFYSTTPGTDAECTYVSSSAQPTWIVGFWLYTGKFTGGESFAVILGGAPAGYPPVSTAQVAFYTVASGKIRAIANNGLGWPLTTLGDTATSLSAATWHYIEIYATIHDSTGVIKVAIDGTIQLNLTGQDTRYDADVETITFQLIYNNEADPEAALLSDLHIFDGTGSVNKDLLGVSEVKCLFPLNEGNYTEWTPNPGSNYENVYDQAVTFPDDDTSYNETATGDAIDTYALDQLIAGEDYPQAVQLVTYVNDPNGAGSPGFRQIIRSNSVDTTSGIFAAYAAYRFQCTQWDTDPGYGTGWTFSHINSVEIGIKQRLVGGSTETRISQEVLEVLWSATASPSVSPSASASPSVEPEIQCYITQSSPTNVSARYYVTLEDHTGTTIALFDNWISLEVEEIVNGVSIITIIFADDDDPRFQMFGLDYFLKVWRSIEGVVDWYVEIPGLIRKLESITDENGVQTWTVQAVGYNDLLARTIIAYNAGTIYADKGSDTSPVPAETVMKEYVYENCGAGAVWGSVVYELGGDIYDGRVSDGVLPGFSVDLTTGSGKPWVGSRAFENLLDVLQDIANFATIDFAVVQDGQAQFRFKTYNDQLGVNRTLDGLDSTTGLNSYGNPPVVLDIPFGNVRNASYVIDGMSEANVIIVLGQGDGSTRKVRVTPRLSRVTLTPWNRREVSRGGQNQEFAYQLEDTGRGLLIDLELYDKYNFSVLQQPSTIYGRDYFLGDTITVIYRKSYPYSGSSGSGVVNKRITKVSIRVADFRETIDLEFADKP